MRFNSARIAVDSGCGEDFGAAQMEIPPARRPSMTGAGRLARARRRRKWASVWPKALAMVGTGTPVAAILPYARISSTG